MSTAVAQELTLADALQPCLVTFLGVTRIYGATDAPRPVGTIYVRSDLQIRD